MEKIDPKQIYISGDIGFTGRFMPMGYSKNLSYVTEIAKRHKQKVFMLIEMPDMDFREEIKK